jgi:basic membrane lipoprotein Med (substrate-binding protein (PBP1-ABC) superfamily)
MHGRVNDGLKEAIEALNKDEYRKAMEFISNAKFVSDDIVIQSMRWKKELSDIINEYNQQMYFIIFFCF